MLNQFIVLENIGEGSYGKVKLAKKQNSLGEEKKYALKIIKQSLLQHNKEFTKDKDGSFILISQ